MRCSMETMPARHVPFVVNQNTPECHWEKPLICQKKQDLHRSIRLTAQPTVIHLHFGGALRSYLPSPRVERAQKSPLIDQIKAATEIELEKTSTDNFVIGIPQRSFDLPNRNGRKVDCGDIKPGTSKSFNHPMIGSAARSQNRPGRPCSLEE
jgi:hypothetical protein